MPSKLAMKSAAILPKPLCGAIKDFLLSELFPDEFFLYLLSIKDQAIKTNTQCVLSIASLKYLKQSSKCN